MACLPAEQVERGELKFRLEGQKLRGSFVLVRLKPKKGSKGNDWLLIKHRDEFATPDWDVEAYPESAVTGRTLEEVRQDLPPGQSAEALSPADLEGAVAAKLPAKARPMLATLLENAVFARGLAVRAEVGRHARAGLGRPRAAAHRVARGPRRHVAVSGARVPAAVASGPSRPSSTANWSFSMNRAAPTSSACNRA